MRTCIAHLLGMRTVSNLVLVPFLSLFALACGPSLTSMQELARAGKVQDDAPLHTTRDVVVQAPRAAVWAILTDFARWPAWQPNVTSVSPPASLTPGAAFRWVNGESEVTSTLALVQASERLAWTGSVSVAKAIHTWRLEETTPGTTRVVVEETMDGFLLTWFYGQKDLDADVARSLEDLRRAAEASARR